MNQDSWNAVDDYIAATLLKTEPVFESVLEASAAAGLPSIAVAPNQGKMLQLLAQICGARKILEVGTLGGYSTIWLAKALPDGGKLISLEYDPHHAQVARANLERAGVADRAEVRVGPAAETLPTLAGEAPFDFVFIDADKANYPTYFREALALSRPGTVIVADNVVRRGGVVDPNGDANAQGVRRMHEMIAAEPRVSATAVQTVGAKGWDGFTLLRVTA